MRSVSVTSEVAQVADGEAVVESARVLEVLALADSQPALADLELYLADPDPVVRRAAVSALTEAVPQGFEFALVQAMADNETRAVAAAGLRELVEVVPVSPTTTWRSGRRPCARTPGERWGEHRGERACCFRSTSDSQNSVSVSSHDVPAARRAAVAGRCRTTRGRARWSAGARPPAGR